jgi:hypothetical protein
MDALKAAGDDIEVRFGLLGGREHMAVKESSNCTASAVACDKERVRRSPRVLLEKLTEAAGDWGHHLAGDREKTRVAKVTRVVLGC